MGKVAGSDKRKIIPPLVIGLRDPGMTPLLRAGLGGLAASLRARLLADRPSAAWPASVAHAMEVPLGPGRAVVEAQRITLAWGEGPPEAVLQDLFEGAFRVHPTHRIIELPGACDPGDPPRPGLAVALQAGLKRTFLQHGSTTKKEGAERSATFEIDEQVLGVTYQPYASFVHQRAWEGIGKALGGGTVELAGWAYPGAAQRHLHYPATKCSYSAGQALCACFALCGCLSFQIPGNGGALIIPEPRDLLRFAARRAGLGPQRVRDAHVAGTGDALLSVLLALRMQEAEGDRRTVAAAHGATLRTTPWAKQQKNRTSLLSPGAVPEAVLDTYREVAEALPSRIVSQRGEEEEDAAEGFFVATSALRGFVAENLARARPWYQGFATATTGGKKPRLLHQHRAKDNLGALRPEEKKGLIAMLSHLEEAERVIVSSVHIALRQRFGAIYEECKDLPLATRKNRFQAEREKWRLLFFGSKTADQIRGALADLWSRAGANRELRDNWPQVLPLLRDERWQVARDLALVALASYQGSREESAEEDAAERAE